jgi:lipopolysaccharide export LptBFGC system permease protein LptF
MNEPALCLFMAFLGSMAGVLSQRARASGVMALILPMAPGLAFWLAIGRG